MTQNQHRGYSLIEILIATVIVGVLLFLVTNMVQKSRETADNSICLSNLRQLASSHFNALAARDGMFLPYALPDGSETPGSYTQMWPRRLMDLGYIEEASQLLVCPSYDFSSTDLTTTYDITMRAGSRYVHYGYNYKHLGGSFRYGGDTYHPASIAQLNNPSRTILLSDSQRPRGNRGSYIIEDRMGDDHIPHARHHGKVHIAFADGHVAAIAIQDPNNPWKELGTALQTNSLWKR